MGMPSREEIDRVHAEYMRVCRWHATYNAVVTGSIFGRSINEGQLDMIDRKAAYLANLRHGPISEG